MAERITMAVLAERLEGMKGDVRAHEALDQERLIHIHARLNLLVAAVGVGLTILISVAGWSLNRVFDNQQDQLALLKSVRAEVMAPEPPSR